MDPNIMLCLYSFVATNLIEVSYTCSYTALVSIIDKTPHGYKAHKTSKIVTVRNIHISLHDKQ